MIRASRTWTRITPCSVAWLRAWMPSTRSLPVSRRRSRRRLLGPISDRPGFRRVELTLWTARCASTCSISSFPETGSHCGRRGRATARGCCWSRATQISDRQVLDLPDLLQPGDVLVFNDTKVIPAQLEGRRGEARSARRCTSAWAARVAGVPAQRQAGARRRHDRFRRWRARVGGRQGRRRIGAAALPRRRADRIAARAGGADAAAALHRVEAAPPTPRTATIIRRCSRVRRGRSRHRRPRCTSRRGCWTRSMSAGSGAKR